MSDSETESEMNQLDNDLFEALFKAMEEDGDLTEARMLLNQGANINARTDHGEDVFHILIPGLRPDMFEFIIENGFNFNMEYLDDDKPLGYNLIMVFVRTSGGDAELARTILKYFPFDLNMIDNEGFSLLHRTITQNKRLYNALPFIKFLIENGVNINAQVENNGEYGGDTALILMAKDARDFGGLDRYLKDIIELLFAYGANQTIRNNRGETVFDIYNQIWPIFRKFRHNREVARSGILQVGANLSSHVNENIYRYLYPR
jgi:ankyrin repeat protein